jgi:hypothetical protein
LKKLIHKSMNFFMTHSKNVKKHNVPGDFVTYR